MTLTSERLKFDGDAEAAESYMERGWTDGLPVVPPTPDRVGRFLEQAGRSPSEIVGAEPTKGRVITVEKVAINAVMAGCRPEYFPVVLAALEAISEPRFNLHAVSVSTMGAAVMTVVNGPIARELRLNSGVSAFGPGNRANATIGRAIQLVRTNVTGAVSGELDKATLGHAGKYTWCIAEAEDVSPWDPLHVERGLSLDESAVTVFAGLSPIQASNHRGDGPEPVLRGFTNALFAAGPGQAEIVVVLCPEHLGRIESEGWTKSQVKEFLFDAGRRTASEWRASGVDTVGDDEADVDETLGVALGVESITLIVAGGPAGGFSAVVPLWGGGSNSRSVTRAIRL
jgi:hypothetical protein